MNKKKKINWKKLIIFFAGVACFITLIISIINIIIWKIDSDKTNKQISKVQQEVVVEEVTDNENTEIIEMKEEIPAFNPYWDYIKMNMINVDFSELKKTNPDIKGWIKINGTNINYPFVQANDNKYYLTHSFNKSYNSSGWVFLDYRNNDTNNKNTIIYAHGRYDNTMFGSLKNVFKSGWLNDKNNYVIKISTEIENTLWEVFSVYRIPTTSDYLQTEFATNKDFLTFITKLKNRSEHNFDVILNETDNILTLSTCYNKADKVVLHARLIKRETKA